MVWVTAFEVPFASEHPPGVEPPPAHFALLTLKLTDPSVVGSGVAAPLQLA